MYSYVLRYTKRQWYQSKLTNLFLWNIFVHYFCFKKHFKQEFKSVQIRDICLKCCHHKSFRNQGWLLKGPHTTLPPVVMVLYCKCQGCPFTTISCLVTQSQCQVVGWYWKTVPFIFMTLHLAGPYMSSRITTHSDRSEMILDQAQYYIMLWFNNALYIKPVWSENL